MSRIIRQYILSSQAAIRSTPALFREKSCIRFELDSLSLALSSSKSFFLWLLCSLCSRQYHSFKLLIQYCWKLYWCARYLKILFIYFCENFENLLQKEYTICIFFIKELRSLYRGTILHPLLQQLIFVFISFCHSV